MRDEEADRDLTSEQALSMIQPLLKRVKKEYAVAEKWLRDWRANFSTSVIDEVQSKIREVKETLKDDTTGRRLDLVTDAYADLRNVGLQIDQRHG